MQKATFAAGCFWGVEEAFRRLPGVTSTQVGFMGGSTKNPTYKDVCHKDTGHAEVVQLEFDPSQISYEQLLAKFWEIHDPTQHNRQGPDVGSQYRSAVFYHSPEQKLLAEKVMAELENKKIFSSAVVTSIEPSSEFYPAEEYHQKYIMKNGGGACHI